MVSTRVLLKNFSHRVAVCSMADVVEDGGVMSLTRQDVYHGWAQIVTMVGSMQNRSGDTVGMIRSQRTHRITMRLRRDLDFTTSTWLYEERLQSGARWFKILQMEERFEEGGYVDFDCRLTERAGSGLNAPVARPIAEPSVDLPAGFRA